MIIVQAKSPRRNCPIRMPAHLPLAVIIGILISLLSAEIMLAGDVSSSQPASTELRSRDYATEAGEVMGYIRKTYYLADRGLYSHSRDDVRPDFTWGNGIMFTALLGAARHDNDTFSPQVPGFFHAMDRYWDKLDTPPGYEPSHTSAGGKDKDYDDNAWMAITFCEAFQMTHDRQYLDRAQQTLDFVLSGWDDRAGGGIWWHELHKGDSKNTCVNAPAAVACLRLVKYLPPDKSTRYLDMAKKLVQWTAKTFDDGGLYSDNINVETGRVRRGKLTYNTALMIRAFLGLYRVTQNDEYLARAQAFGQCRRLVHGSQDRRLSRQGAVVASTRRSGLWKCIAQRMTNICFNAPSTTPITNIRPGSRARPMN